jgi:hypothetical protein
MLRSSVEHRFELFVSMCVMRSVIRDNTVNKAVVFTNRMTGDRFSVRGHHGKTNFKEFRTIGVRGKIVKKERWKTIVKRRKGRKNFRSWN